MKTTRIIASVLFAITALAAVPGLAGMPNMPGMPNNAAGVKTGKGVGVITALDPRVAKITIKHSAIPSVGWPAMTMTFSAKPPALLKGLKVGQTIGFNTRVQGATADVTAIQSR
jgi:Cu(I)/Ag(I) efflux system protein CusF